jgi:hypothetical protein
MALMAVIGAVVMVIVFVRVLVVRHKGLSGSRKQPYIL